ncbi:hypothetical protein KJ567_06380, partial [Candidatus Bipolaricaulota bacterium]|nr:hypothetical protein [Candidatus Bipolaricaulota bacterium]
MNKRIAATKHGLVIALTFVGFLAWIVPATTMDGNDPQAAHPLYLTIVVHNEEDTGRGVVPKANIPDYDGDPALMAHFASAMRTFAQMAAGHGARINFGSDWTFSRGVALYEPSFYTDLEAMGHEVDAHAHESSVLYREVREAIVTAGGHPTAVASGMDETTIQAELAYFS